MHVCIYIFAFIDINRFSKQFSCIFIVTQKFGDFI